MVFITTFNNISVYCGSSYIGGETNLPQVTDKLYHIMYPIHLAMSGIRPKQR